MTMEPQPVEDVSALQNGDFPLSMLVFGGYMIIPWLEVASTIWTGQHDFVHEFTGLKNEPNYTMSP